jgi:hypothetical protein
MQNKMDNKIADMKSELILTKNEVREISETLKTATMLLSNINQNTSGGNHHRKVENETTILLPDEYKENDNDKTMIDIKQHGRMRVTRSQTRVN